MKRFVRNFDLKFNAMSMREKLMVFGVAIVGIIFLWQFVLWKSVAGTRTELNSKYLVLTKTIPHLQSQLKVVTTKFRNFTKQAANKQVPNGKATILKPRKRFVSPTEMVQVLRKLLNVEQGLQLISMRNLPVRQAGDLGKKNSLLAHGVIIRFRGNYFETMDYLRQLEKLDWQFFWDRLDYSVVKYPQAEITLQLHTLSDTQGWLHV